MLKAKAMANNNSNFFRKKLSVVQMISNLPIEKQRLENGTHNDVTESTSNTNIDLFPYP